MAARDDSFTTQVLVVGAGPVGLSLAIELGLRGIAVTLMDQRDRTGPQPRAKTTNVRSMTHMRRWGVADALRAAAPLPRDYPTDVVFATKLFGHRLTVFENAFAGAKRQDARFPEPAQWVPQYIVEKILHEKITRLPSVRFLPATAFERLSQSATDVAVTVRDVRTEATRVVRAALRRRRRWRAQHGPRRRRREDDRRVCDVSHLQRDPPHPRAEDLAARAAGHHVLARQSRKPRRVQHDRRQRDVGVSASGCPPAPTISRMAR